MSYKNKLLIVVVIFIILLYACLNIFTVSLSQYNKAILNYDGRIEEIEGRDLLEIKEMLTNKMFSFVDKPACGFFERNSIKFYDDSETLTYMIPQCSCGYIYIDEKDRYLSLTKNEMTSIKTYIDNYLNRK